MKKIRMWALLVAVLSAALAVVPSASAKKRAKTVNPDDPTYQLYQLLNNSYGGKLKDLYVLANVYTDPLNPKSQLQHVLRVQYDNSRFFGRLRIQVRSVGKLTPQQLKTYSPKQIYDFGEEDVAEFEKIDPGPLGQTGDLYTHVNSNGVLAPAPVTAEVTKQYDSLIMDYILPALKTK